MCDNPATCIHGAPQTARQFLDNIFSLVTTPVRSLLHEFMACEAGKGNSVLGTALAVAAVAAAVYTGGTSLGYFGADAAADAGAAGAADAGTAAGTAAAEGGADAASAAAAGTEGTELAANGSGVIGGIGGAGTGAAATAENAAVGTGIGGAATTGAEAGGVGAAIQKYAPAVLAASSLASTGASVYGAMDKSANPTVPAAVATPPAPTINGAEQQIDNEVSNNSAKGALANLLQPVTPLMTTNTSLRQLLGA